MRDAAKQISRTISHVDRKFLDYEFVEQIVLPVNNIFSGGGPLSPNSRCYFGPNNKLKGKRIIGITVPAGPDYVYNGITIIRALTSLDDYRLTIINDKGDEQIKDFPLADLNPTRNGGKTRIFNIIPDIEKSYIVTSLGIGVGSGLVFNFYTVSW